MRLGWRRGLRRRGRRKTIESGADGSELCGDLLELLSDRVLAAGVTGDLRPYRLRGSFVSLLLWSGEDLVYVADQAGHSVATLARHYAGVIRELRDVPKVPAAELIEAAREEVTATNGTHRGRTY